MCVWFDQVGFVCSINESVCLSTMILSTENEDGPSFQLLFPLACYLFSLRCRLPSESAATKSKFPFVLPHRDLSICRSSNAPENTNPLQRMKGPTSTLMSIPIFSVRFVRTTIFQLNNQPRMTLYQLIHPTWMISALLSVTNPSMSAARRPLQI